jgi:surface antigen
VPTPGRRISFYRRWELKFQRKTVRRRAIRTVLLLSNIALLGLILTFVLQSQKSDSLPAAAVSSAAAAGTANPLDQLSSADIAQTVAQLNGLPETTAITNQAQSKAAEVAIASSTDNVVSKPQVVTTSLKSKSDIQTYTTQANDSVSGLAAKFGVTSDSIRWSNGLNGDAIPAGTKLTIPPVNGIVYTVKPGDTPASLAAQFRSNSDQITAYNDAEIAGLTPGEQIIIPNAIEITSQTASQVAATSSSLGSGAGFLWGNGPVYGSNGYDYGYCTWYVATQVPVPANWGNASTWAYYARMSGWHVSSAPTVGAIAQKGGGEGHVAIVTGVNADGSVQVRDMNGFAGWGRVGNGTVSSGTFQNYITH